MKIEIPYSLEQVTIKQWQKAVQTDDPLRKVSILSGISYNDLRDYPRDLTKQAEVLAEEVLNTEPKQHKNVFKLNGQKVGFINDWTKLSTGEYVDLETYCKDSTVNAHKIMKVLFRPLQNELGDKYKIQPYEKALHENEFLDAPASQFIGALVFFWNIRANYLSDSLLSLAKVGETNLPNGGGGMTRFSNWLTRTLQKLKKLLGCR